MQPAKTWVEEMRRCAIALQQGTAIRTARQHGFCESVRDDACFGHYGNEAVRGNGPTANSVDMGTPQDTAVKAAFKMSAAARNGGVFDLKDRHRIAFGLVWPKPDLLACDTMDAQVATRIDDYLTCAVLPHGLKRAIDGVTLGYAAEVEPNRLSKAHAVIVSKFDVAPVGVRIGRAGVWGREDSAGNEVGRDRDVEAAVRGFGHCQCVVENLERGSMNSDQPIARLAIEPADVAFGFVKAHETMNQRDFFKRLVDSAMRLRFGESLDADCDPRP